MDVFEYMQFTTKIAVLKIFENNSDDFLTSSEIKQLSELKNRQRKNEFVSTRALRTYLFGKHTILYNEFGAPFLEKKDVHISISHNKEYVVIAWSNKHPVGVDIEMINRDVSSIEKKFISQNEREIASTIDSPKNALTIWCIKETLYKLYQKKELDFLNDLSCNKINTEIWKGNIIKNKKLEYLFYIKIFQNQLICFNFEN